MTFGKLIRTKRIELGISQLQLGKIIGASRVSFYMWEADKIVPNTFYGARICKALGITMDEFTKSFEGDGVI